MKHETPIGSFTFVDGITRTIFLDQHGRQYARNQNGIPVFGIWLFIDDPAIVGKFQANESKQSLKRMMANSAPC